MRFRSLAGGLICLFLVAVPFATSAESAPEYAAKDRWSAKRANDWYASQPWLVGSNFIPSTAINELEMWQADTFDLATIDRELGWAQNIGMNTMRVFLHNLAWKQDPAGFLGRMDKFLAVADKHHIRIMFVLLDSVWDPNPQIGKQRAPKPHTHNSGWVQAPGAEILKNPASWSTEVEPYIKAVVGRFGDDRRVVIWDLMNEPDEQSGGRRAASRESVGLGAQRETFATAHQRRVEETRFQRRLKAQRDGKIAARKFRRHHFSQLRSSGKNARRDSIAPPFSSSGDLHRIYGSAPRQHV
jgi:hypothetical protein